MRTKKILQTIGCAVGLGALTGCINPTGVAITSQPSGAWVHVHVDQPGFYAMKGVGKDGHRETPTSISVNWKTIKSDNVGVKVIWPEDRSESAPVTIPRGSPDLSIQFTKDQEPKVDVATE